MIIVKQRLDKIRSIGLNCANLSFRSGKAILECEKLAKKAKKKFYDQKIAKIRNSCKQKAKVERKTRGE